MAEDSRRLPQGYVIRRENAAFVDSVPGITYQPLVYELAAFLAERSGARRLVDIGCGSAAKLKGLQERVDLTCIDNADGLALARDNLERASFIAADLEAGLPQMPEGTCDGAIVMCADVLEHLRSPERLARDLARLLERARFVLVSTPDRTRARGLLDCGPPANPAHTMEWSADEFGRFLRDCGWPSGLFLGHTINTDVHQAKITTLALAGREACPAPAPAPARVAAIIHTYNESDIIGEVVAHLQGQGVSVHIFDNWSTDGTFEIAQAMPGVSVSRFPEKPTPDYQWHRQLEHTARYAATLDADWVIHHDADEIRCSPWRGVTLAEAFARIDALGYDAVDFTVIEFRYLKERSPAQPPYGQSLTFFELGRRPGLFRQVKAWKNRREPVDLASSGGHEASFPGRRIYPLKFLTRHYPLRTPEQARRKIFEDRLPRAIHEQRQRNWHTHYAGFKSPADLEGWERHGLIPWHQAQFESEYLVERLSGLGI